METVTVSRRLAADPEEVRAAMEDVERFMAAAGFDEVHVDGREFRIVNRVGIATIELELVVRDDPDHALVYEQVDGVFSSMRTVYDVEPTDDGCEVTAATEFAVDVALVGMVLDATVVKRQRRKELTAQFDWLAEQFGEGAP